VALIAGCGGSGGGGSDVMALDGVYQASSDNQDTMGCGAGAPSGSLPIFRIESATLLGTNTAKFEFCTSTAPSSCLDLGALSIRFTVRTGDGWTDDAYGGDGSGTICVLTHDTSTLTTTGANQVDVVFETHSVQTSTPSGGCTPTAARAAASTMSCTKREEMVATRVN
jgi:hypothetical protein